MARRGEATSRYFTVFCLCVSNDNLCRHFCVEENSIVGHFRMNQLFLLLLLVIGKTNETLQRMFN